MENTASNVMMNVVPQESSYSFFVFVVIGLVVIAGIAILFLQWKESASPWSSQRRWSLNYDTIRNWWSATPVGELGIAQSMPMAPAPTMAPPTAVPGAATPSKRYPTKHQKESWCFVGEDLTGRYCVKVPSEKSCDTDRLFGTRKDCELTPANHMATGIVKENGESMLPLAKMRFG